MTIREVPASEFHLFHGTLAELLFDVVENGASLNFMSPMRLERAWAFWATVYQGLQKCDRILLVAMEGEQLLGTAQLVLAHQENQPHRADVAKVMVRPDARRRGIAAALMREVEVVAARVGRTVLVLDTAEGQPAEQLYLRLGWSRMGVIPHYALFPDGRSCNAVFFYKRLHA